MALDVAPGTLVALTGTHRAMGEESPQSASRFVLRHPARFARDVFAGFRANRGLLLAGAVAYYALLSLIPLLILLLIALSHVIDEARLLAALREYLEFVVPGQSAILVADFAAFLSHRTLVGGVVVASMLVFSALAFTVLENAMAVIFHHRTGERKRHFAVSALMPYVFIVFLGLGLLVVTLVSGRLAALASRDVTLFGMPTSLEHLSNFLLYALGVGGEVMVLTAIYLVMPVGRLSWRHALIGGLAAGVLW
ncbi:MAG: YhjD/YihY/BrkB family envelope integrity protein, partial [Casimicrobiaceae bacterium]